MKTLQKTILFIVYFLLLVYFPLFSETRPIVQVDPVVNLSDEAWLSAVCDAATDNVIFTLKFLGQFDVVSDTSVENETGQLVNAMEVDRGTFDTSILKTRAEIEGYDNILFGSCTIEDGSYVITMNAYDLALDKITYSGSTVVESIFDTFEAVDQITYQTVEGFSGIHVTYGSLVLVPPDTGEPFSFTIDGIALPEGVYSVDRMPAGIHELAISQERPYGLYESVHEIEVVEEIENRITISLPDIAGEEIPVFRQADRYLTLLTTGKETGVVLAMNNLNSLLDTSFFQEFRSGVVQKYDRWVSMLEEDVLLSYKTDRLKPAYYVRSLWDSERKKSISNEVSLSSNNRIQQSAFETLVSNEYMLANIQTIVIDGNGADWNNITSIYNDPLNDFASQSGNHLDIEQIKFAIDHKYLYIYAETVDGFDSSDYMFNWHTSDSTHVLYFDFFHWKGVKEIDISIGYVEHGSDKHQRFKQFEQKIDAVYGKIFEAAIPLDYLMDFSLFSETMEIRGRTEDWTVSESFDVDDFNFTLQLPILEAMIKSGNDSNVFTDSVKLWDFNESKDGWRTAGNEKLSIEKIEGRNVLKLGFDGRENVIELKSQSFDTMDFSNKSVEIKFWGPSEWTRDMEIQFTAFNNSGRWKGSEGVSDAYSVRKNSWNIQRYNFYPTTRGEGDIKKIRSISFEFVGLEDMLNKEIYIDYIRIIER